MIIHIGADHGGFELKTALVEYLKGKGHEVVDHGAHEFDNDDNYPDFIFPVAQAVNADKSARGIVIGGSGQGEAIAANKFKGVRAMTYYGSVLPVAAVDASGRESTDALELVKLSRLHNDTNVISFGARFLSAEDAKDALDLWLEMDATVETRYQARIDAVENNCYCGCDCGTGCKCSSSNKCDC